MTWPALTLGVIVALLVLVVAVVLIVAQGFSWPLVLIAALAVARLT
jgi:hypothetical protein